MFISSLLKGKVAIVTGGGTGLGLAIAKRMGELGADIAVGSRQSEHLEDGTADLRHAGLDPLAVQRPKGHAIECRIYAEDPDNNFLPSPGRIRHLRAPAGPGIRDDSGAAAGLDVPIFYDPMISKLIAWAEDRPQAVARMRRALDEYLITGIRTTVPFFRWLLTQPSFESGAFHTTYLDGVLAARNGRPFVEPTPEIEDVAAIAAAIMAATAGDGMGAETSSSPWRTQARVEGLR